MKRLILVLTIFCFAFSAQAQTTKKYDAFKVEVSGTGPHLILIPGAACSGEVWKETVKSLSKEYTCHVLTLAGYAGVKPFKTPPILAQITAALKNYIKTEASQPIVMGHSIGGFLSLQLASQSKDLIQKVIVVDALPFLVAAGNPTMTEEMAKQMPLEPMLKQYQQMDEDSFKAMQSQVIASMVTSKLDLETVLKWSMRSDRATMVYTMNEMMTNDLRDDLHEISIPVLVLGAYSKSSPYTKEQTTNLYQTQYKNLASLDLKMADNSKHFIMLDAPEWYMQEVKAFLSKKSL